MKRHFDISRRLASRRLIAVAIISLSVTGLLIARARRATDAVNVANSSLPIESDDDADTKPNTDAPLEPTEAARKMIVPEGFEVTLFAAEPDVRQPIGFCIDDRGRLWVAEAYNYPKHGTKAGDRIVILEDSDGDGRFDKRTVFYDQLNYVTGIEVGFGGAWVMSPPYFYFIPDRNGDDRPDGKPQVLLDGFGNHANAHNLANGFAWGPDGWLYGTHGRTNWSLIGRPGARDDERVRFDGGVYRYHPTRHVWEPYADGTTNPWGIDWDDYGQSFICNCVNPHLFHVIAGAHYEPSRNRKSSQYAYERIPTIADHLHFTGVGNVRDGIGSEAEDTAGGGHAHCGTMVYLGDSFPDRYRNTLFTNNIHGRRINNDILKRSGSGYVASHGPDLMRSRDAWFMGVMLQYGPDGSVFVIDWSDTGECHSVRNTRRETGRIYRISYGTPKQVATDLVKRTNEQLVTLQSHRNDWFVRHARRILQERAATGADMSAVHKQLRLMFAKQETAPRKLRALWALHVTGGIDDQFLIKQLSHDNEHLRGWAIQLLAEGRQSGNRDTPRVTADLSLAATLAPEALIRMRELAAQDDSALVRLTLASTLQRLPLESRWPIARALLTRGEDRDDPNLPLMNWYAVEPLVAEDLAQFVALIDLAEIPLVRRHISRRVASIDPKLGGLDHLVAAIATARNTETQLDMLDGILVGLQGRRRVSMPSGWPAAYARLQSRRNDKVQDRAVRLALIFDDADALAQLRRQAIDGTVTPATRNRAIDALVGKRVKDFATVLLKLVPDNSVRTSVIRGLAEYNHADTAETILRYYRKMTPADREQAVQTLASRREWAAQLLQAVSSGRVPRTDLSAFAARQIQNIGDKKLTERLEALWGTVRQTPARRAREIANYRKRLTPATLTRADLPAGRVVFQKLCANCHRLFDSGGRVGPDITGSQRTNLEYLLENLLDPSAAVSKDFQMEIVRTDSGRVITGLVVADTDAALTIQTVKERLVIPVDEIDRRRKSEVSMMPEGQLKDLTFDQVRDLFGYLNSGRQVPLPPGKGLGESPQ